MRIIGYDQVPTAPLATPIPLSQPDPAQAVKEEVRDLLASIGMQEIITYSMVSGQALELAHRGVEPAAPPMRAFNPISAEHEFLRTSLRPGLLRTLAANQRHEGLPQWYFEVGKEFLFYGEGLPDERQKAAGVLSGPGTQASWAAQEAAAGFYDAKGVVESMCTRLGVTPSFEPLDDPFYYPGRAAVISAGGQRIGELGEVHPEALEAFDVRGEGTVYFEVDLASLTAAVPQAERRFRGPSVYPEALRDLALVVGVDVPAASVQEVIEQHPLVAHATLFDVYAGEQLGRGRAVAGVSCIVAGAGPHADGGRGAARHGPAALAVGARTGRGPASGDVGTPTPTLPPRGGGGIHRGNSGKGSPEKR